ncbi:protein DDI1 homolog 2-like isoform X2 [Portunus trituberculatus]|uniref:protein DDI1 homolog 2-like isoform X2 n=2 Tax=Portunus trituberculatus TaxID=210409 RepID=UPI001E1D0AA4|nr:protein DDI1 homolog 2-like isoform X2 [Portunus trituberculatus]
MRLSVNIETQTILLEVAEDLEMENFKALVEMEAGIPAKDMFVIFNAQQLSDDKKTLKDYGVKDGELLMVLRRETVLGHAAQFVQQRRQQQGQQIQQQQQRGGSVPAAVGQIDFSSIQLPRHLQRGGNSAASTSTAVTSPTLGDSTQATALPTASQDDDDPAVIRDMLLANPDQLALLKYNNPKLAEAVTGGDLEKFATVLREQQEVRRNREQQRIRLLTADPFDMEAQRLIANEIQQENINSNMETAMEYNPESFGLVHMLYINCKVNGHDVKAFIDSGAQMTIMSQACAERCSIMRLVDKRWAGVAKGVGTQPIIGRVHLVQIQIEGDFLASSFAIMADQPMDMLLGLDVMKRHQMSIDLKNNQLHIGTTGTSTAFLSESELPDCGRLTRLNEEEARLQSERMAEDRALAEALAASAKEGAGTFGEGMEAGSQDPNTNKGESTKENAKEGTAATAAATSPSPQSQAANPDPPMDNFSESDVQEIIGLGFSRSQAVEELRRQNGNKTQAMAALFVKSLKMIYIQNLLPSHDYRTHNRTLLPPPVHRLRKFRHSITYLAPAVWNSIPHQIQEEPSLTLFKKKLKRHTH